VYGVQDRAEYWQNLGSEVHDRLRVGNRPSSHVDYGQY